MKKENKKEMEHFLNSYKHYEDRGVKFVISGKEETLETIAQVCIVKERGSYMGDFIGDESGKVIEIHFDKITEIPEDTE